MPLTWRRRAAVVPLVAVTTSLALSPAAALAAGGQLLFAEPFDGPTTSAPVVPVGNGGAALPCLTAGATDAATTTTPLPGCGVQGVSVPPVPPGEHDALRFTNTKPGPTTGVIFNTTVPLATGLDIAFDQYQWSNGGVAGGNGIAFALIVAPSLPSTLGSSADGLGYAPGLPFAWLGVGLDAHGGFSSSLPDGAACSVPSWAAAAPNQVTVRGSGNGLDGWCLLGSTLGQPVNPMTGVTLEAPTRNASRNRVEITVNRTPAPGAPVGTYAVTIQPLATDPPPAPIALVSGALPESFVYPETGQTLPGGPSRLLFAIIGSNGSSVDVHEIGNLTIKTLTGSAPVESLSVAGDSSVNPGTTTTFTATAGVAASSPVAEPDESEYRITAPVPAGMTLAATPSGSGWICSPSTTAVDCLRTTDPVTPIGAVLPPLSIPFAVPGGAVDGASLTLDATVVTPYAARPVNASHTVVVSSPSTVGPAPDPTPGPAPDPRPAGPPAPTFPPPPIGHIVDPAEPSTPAPLSVPVVQDEPAVTSTPGGQVVVDTGVIVNCDANGPACTVATTVTTQAPAAPGQGPPPARAGSARSTRTLTLAKTTKRLRPGTSTTPTVRIRKSKLRRFPKRKKITAKVRVTVTRKGVRRTTRTLTVRFKP